MFPDLKNIAARLAIGLSIATLTLVFLFTSVSEKFFLKFFYTGFFSHHSFFERWVQIVNSWNVFLENPFFGKGIGGVGQYLFDLFYNTDRDILLRLSIEPGFSGKAFDPMNVLTEILASLGVFGLISFLYLFYSYYSVLKEYLHKMKHQEDMQKLGIIFFISLLVTLIVLQFNQGLFRTYIWVHLAITAAYMHKKIALGQGK
jgi:O-antigen ligase